MYHLHLLETIWVVDLWYTVPSFTKNKCWHCTSLQTMDMLHLVSYSRYVETSHSSKAVDNVVRFRQKTTWLWMKKDHVLAQYTQFWWQNSYWKCSNVSLSPVETQQCPGNKEPLFIALSLMETQQGVRKKPTAMYSGCKGAGNTVITH